MAMRRVASAPSPSEKSKLSTTQEPYGRSDRGHHAWWRARRQTLLSLASAQEAVFVYDRESIISAARSLLKMTALSRVHYAIKANPHSGIIRLLDGIGLSMECVSRGELERVFRILPKIDRQRVMFTPNFAARDEYSWAIEQGISPTIDNLYILEKWGSLFRGRSLVIRVDTGIGRGHHKHVQTAGGQSKFGVALDELDALDAVVRRLRLTIRGLHAHTGSGITDVANWVETAEVLALLTSRFPGATVIDIGGGLPVADREGAEPLDLGALGLGLSRVMSQNPRLELWMEPGRFLVAPGGVLLARTTQLKRKGNVRYVGISTGMNSIIRPALYDAYHEIFNLTRLNEASTEIVNVVGPICESADVLGQDRLLPPTQEGDVLLIANAGAYCHAMSSNYNLRAPASEVLI